MSLHTAGLIELSLEVDHKLSEINRIHDSATALNAITDNTSESFIPVIRAMGISSNMEYSTESKMSMLQMFAKGAMVAGTLLVSYFEHLEDQLTEMTRVTTDFLDEMSEYEWDFKKHSKTGDLKTARVIIQDRATLTVTYFKNKPVKELDRLIYEMGQVMNVTDSLTGSLYDRILDVDAKSNNTADVLSMMRIMKTVDTTRNYLGGRRIESNFNHKDNLKISWSAQYFNPQSIIYDVELADFSTLLETCRSLVRTIKTTKETLKLSKQSHSVHHGKTVRDNVVNQLYIPLMLDMVKMKDVCIVLMKGYVKENKGVLK